MPVSLAIGVDLGGTNLKVGVVDERGKLVARRSQPTGMVRGAEAILNDIATLAQETIGDAGAARHQVIGVGVGTPGPLSPKRGVVYQAANLPGWADLNLRDQLTERLKLPVAIDNDGNAAALAEHWVGAGAGVDDMVMLTLGTGVGAGVILGGKICAGAFENAGELGHVIVQVGGRECTCGQRGCLERYASAIALENRFAEAIASGAASTLTPDAGGQCSAEMIIAAARQGDVLCRELWDEVCLYLAVGCVNIQHAFNATRVILGGGMAGAGRFLVDSVKKQLAAQRWKLMDDLPEVVLAKLGDAAGVVGAAALIWRRQKR